jgi:C1A family cysteine protease
MFFLASCSFALAVARPQIDPSLPLEKQFNIWATHYNKDYTNEEKVIRFKMFSDTVRKVYAHNKKFDAGLSTYRQGLNHLSAHTKEEYRVRLGFKQYERAVQPPYAFPYAHVQVTPEDVNWGEKGAVTGVKDQGQCGSCWTFSATGAMEGAASINSGYSFGNFEADGFSEQQIVDCDHEGEDAGCNGGDMSSAMNWTVNNGGLVAEESYPYDAMTGLCRAPTGQLARDLAAVTITGFVDVPADNSTALMQAIKMQPVSVAIDANCDEFQNYQSGVFDGGSCGTSLDHGVLLTGYSKYVNKRNLTEGYLLMKNSWGDWGDGGYMKIALHDGKGVMGVNMQPSFPTGATMASNYSKPKFCGEDEHGSKKNTTFHSCAQTNGAESCCCTEHSTGILKGCINWVCCTGGKTCDSKQLKCA